MGPVVVTCEGCGVRIRIPKPESALERSCPRCSTPLAAAITKRLAPEPVQEESLLGINLNTSADESSPSTNQPRKRAELPLLVACLVVFMASALALSVWLSRDRGSSRSVSVPTQPHSPLALKPAPVADVDAHQNAKPQLARAPGPAVIGAPSNAEPLPAPKPTPSDPDSESDPMMPPADPMPSATTVAIRGATEPTLPLPPRSEPVLSPTPKPSPPPPPSPATTAAPATSSPEQTAKRVRIRTRTGETVVARVYGESEGKTSVMLPNGELGFTNGTAETDEPFVPATMEQLRQELTGSGPFANYEVLESDHYLVLYKSSAPFAKASQKLLEDLYKTLFQAFKKRELPIHDPEFPLVAIIFPTEAQFRAYQKVDSDVQAYYEILSNRIYLYEKSDQDQQSPEVAAMRKPQTVAHEGTHQILQNIGIHPRLAPWPLWLVEGLAEYCSPPTMTRRGAVWGGLGQVNSLHMATIHDLDDPAALFVNGGERKPLGRDRRKPLVEYLVTRSTLTPTDYALSWALTHYLAVKREPQFLEFIRTMSQLTPLSNRSPEDQLASFRDAFGTDLAKLDKAIANYLAKLKYDPLPFYAVVFEQPISGNQLRRAMIVSQSPSMIQQWLSQMTDPNGGATFWNAFPHTTRARAQLTAEQWIRSR